MGRRMRAVVAALGLTGASLLGLLGPGTHADGAVPPATVAAAGPVRPGPHDDGPHPPLLPPSTVHPRAVAPAVTSVQPLTGGGYAVAGLDLHDGMLAHWDGTYYLYGTEYACGYEWYVQSTPWCGFGVSTASSLTGPWSTPTLLFSPADVDPWSGLSWVDECGSSGQGCFNPRMIRRDTWGSRDGTFILWFNSPVDYSRSHGNAYNAMGCNSPVGPCGPAAGAPHGSYSKPSLSVCAGNGDFGMILSGGLSQTPAIVCTMPGATALNLEELNQWGVGGDGTGVRTVAGITGAEGPGGWWDPTSNQYIITFSDPGCGYCAGTATGYATAPTLYNGWVSPTNVGFSPPAGGRRGVTATSCGGQPRTVSVVDGTPLQMIDTWDGDRNEAAAGLVVAPLSYEPAVGVAGDGARWAPAVSYTC